MAKDPTTFAGSAGHLPEVAAELGKKAGATASKARIDPKTGRQMRGLALCSPERRREVARKGGLAVPKEKRTFFRDPELQREAATKGGYASRGGGRRKPKD